MNVSYRLCSEKYRADSGDGAARWGGRWNPPGVKLIYSASTLGLAALEILVNFSELPQGYAASEIGAPGSLAIEYLSDGHLPKGWDMPTGSPGAQELGARWVSEQRSLLLSVPSSVIQTERNLLINPAHPNFDKIVFLPPEPFEFDPRLKTAGPKD